MDTKIISIEFATTEANHAQFFGQVIVDVTAQPVTRSATASGDVVIPSVNVDGVPVDPDDPEEEPVVIGSTEEQTITVSLPMSWQEDGHADVIFSFEFNNQMIPVHYPQENWHSGRHTILLYYPIEDVVPNYTNIFNVYMRCEGGTAAVDTGMCIASIFGQSMGASAAWDGRIDIEEYVDLFRIGDGSQNGRLQVKAFTEADEWEVKETMRRYYSDVTLISLGFTSAMRCIGETGSTDCCLTILNDIIVAYDFEIDVNDHVIPLFAGEHCGNVSTPFFQYKEYVFAWGGAYLNQYRYTWLLTPYLATICNLSQAVVKNADKTMKVTYTLTEQTVT